jgi:hypothetical protein
MTEPRPPLRLVGSPRRDDATDSGFDPVERAPHDLHPPYRERSVVESGADGPDDQAEPPRSPMSPRFVIVALIVAQLLVASTFLGKYAGLVQGDDMYKVAACLAVPASLCLYLGAALMVLRPGRGRALFITAAAGFGLALPFWGVGYNWSWPMAFGAILALAGAWFARAEVHVDDDAAAQP